jgi:hypothetical protein
MVIGPLQVPLRNELSGVVGDGPDAQAEGLKAVKASEDISESEQIRQALNEWLRKKGVMKSERKRAVTRKHS